MALLRRPTSVSDSLRGYDARAPTLARVRSHEHATALRGSLGMRLVVALTIGVVLLLLE